MSMKRVRKTGSSGDSHADAPLTAFGRALPGIPTWKDAVEAKSDASFTPWSLSAKFSRDELIEHPKFGRGVVVLVVGTTIEVLFQEGTKKLAHAG